MHIGDGEDISPTTSSVGQAGSGSRIANGSAAVHAQPSGLRNGIGPQETAEATRDAIQPTSATNGNPRKNLPEAADYINGGVQHEQPRPRASPTIKPSVLRYPHPPTANDAPVLTATGTITPPGRRSVQFMRTDPSPEYMVHTRQESLGVEDGEAPSKDRRGQSLMAKLKLLTSTAGLQTHSRSQSNTANSIDDGSASAPLSPVGRPHRFPNTLQEEGSDADAEETADEDVPPDAVRVKRKRRMRRPQVFASESQTAPNTPRPRGVPQSDSPNGSRIHPFLGRRATDGSLEQRGHLSEGEGRDRLGSHSAWRRGSSWISSARGLGTSGQQPGDPDGGTTARRPSQFRRAFTGLGGQSDGDGPASRRPFLGGERGPTFGAQRWRIIKHSLKLLGTKKEEHRVDYLKSAELMAELRAGAPAALMLASMIQRDEHGNKRIPVLLEQLKIRITDSKSSADDPAETERHLVFKIELEYGSGLNRMKWIIHRTLRDFANLHLRYKIQAQSDKYLQLRSDVDSRPKQPRFPRSTFPYFRGVRGLGESEDDEADNIRIDETVGEATHSETEKRRKKRRSSLGGPRRKSVAPGADLPPGATGPKGETNVQTRLYNEKQRRRLEQYLQEMIRWLIFRADSNRLCRFLELSALGVRLAAEGSYHGKEGFMVIQSSKGLDFRRLLTPRNFFARNSPKWFLVRHSYIVCVESPENMQIYDVYLVDPKFEIHHQRRKFKQMGSKEILHAAETSAKHPQHHGLRLHNSERKIKLLAKNERQLRQFEESITFMVNNTLWSKPNRFESFAPVRTGVYAQWLVDGRDYMWNVSRAINMAKDVIYIHDWWLSPQLYMRRPAAISQKWRLDRLLQKKAKEGVKIFIIIYRNVEAAIPIDSEFTKISMLDLHPNVFVQRSPNQFKKNQFFFAHHEKICVVDHTVAFVGGIDLCFGRWDTPQHSVVDDKPTGFEQSDLPKDADHCQLWPGKDYSNPREQDFYQLQEPYAEMYDRSKVPRMPWHDVSMQVVGQPARDLTRHFVQRWNYVLRGRNPTRPTPFLLPPPDYNAADLEDLGLSGTCEVQILRSATDWSLGLVETEHSIMNAYCKMIEESEHFVYIENQFFITSCETMNVKIVNKIGDAIVERAVRAFRNNESWRCVILIPLMPGFQNTVDEPEGTSVRLIMQCQFRSICRGEGSIFGRLRSQGIEPEDYVQFYSLRTWGRIGPKKTLVTEQLYIHAKVIIVDDRTALIGSANINERSMLGIRDSECAAVVRDTDMIWSTMDGEPYLVGRFAHTLRMRLMREHLGLDVDEVMEDERRAELEKEAQGEYETKMNDIYPDESDSETQPLKSREELPGGKQRASVQDTHTFNHDINLEEERHLNLQSEAHKPIAKGESTTQSGNDTVNIKEGAGTDHREDDERTGAPDTYPPNRHRNKSNGAASNHGGLPPMPFLPRRTTEELGLPQLSQLPTVPLTDDTDIGGPPVHVDSTGNPAPRAFNPVTADIKIAAVDKDCMRDPLNDCFFEDTWRLIAENNTKIFRRVFRCNPDSEVTNWHEYTEFVAYAGRFSQSQSGSKSTEREEQDAPGKSGPVGATLPGAGSFGQGLANISEKVNEHKYDGHPLGTVSEWAEEANQRNKERREMPNTRNITPDGHVEGASENATIPKRSDEALSPTLPAGDEAFPSYEATTNPPPMDAEKISQPTPRKTTFSSAPDTVSLRPTASTQGSTKRRRRGTTKSTRRGFTASDGLLSPNDIEELLSLIQGHLVLFPYDWLIKEELNSNWLYQVDQVAPLQIYD